MQRVSIVTLGVISLWVAIPLVPLLVWAAPPETFDGVKLTFSMYRGFPFAVMQWTEDISTNTTADWHLVPDGIVLNLLACFIGVFVWLLMAKLFAHLLPRGIAGRSTSAPEATQPMPD